MENILIDDHESYEKPAFNTGANKRTPYCERISPIFKNFSAVYKYEKGLEANKKSVACLDDGQKKLMDGVEYNVRDKARGEVDGEHTEEGTLKLMEVINRCFKNETGR